MKPILQKQLELKLSKFEERKFFSYGKSRVSGSKKTTYIMHCRSANMPGQVNVFTNNSITNPDDKTEENMLRLRNLFKREKHELLNQSIGPKFNHNHLSLYTYKI